MKDVKKNISDINNFTIDMSVIHMNPLEEALNKLDLKGTILLITVLSQRALHLKEQEDLKVSSILTPNPLSTIVKP